MKKIAIFVDVQNDFISGALRSEKAIETTPRIVEFAKKCVAEGWKIYATRDTHEKTVYGVGQYLGADMSEEPQSGYMTTLEGRKLPVEHCVEGTDGWMIDPRLMDAIEGKCTVVNKPTFGSFDLADIIREDFSYETADGKPEEFYKNDIGEIVLVGFCTGICVAANAVILRARFPNTKITVMKDLCSCVTEESHDAALKTLAMQQIDVV